MSDERTCPGTESVQHLFPPHAVLLTLIFGVAFGISSFVVTRGADGSLSGLVYSFGTLSLLYLVYITIDRTRVSSLLLIAQLFLFELFACIGMLIDSRLDEMAGMLYLMISAVLPVIVGGGATILVIKRLASRR